MRFMQNLVVCAALEATYGVDASPAGSDAILLSNVSINPLKANNVQRDLVRGYFGGSPELVGTKYVELTFTFELAGSGTATTPPKWGRIMQAMGFAQTTQTASVDYTPISTFGANSSLTISYYLDGAFHKLLGARGTWELNMKVGQRPEIRCRFIGKYVAPTATAAPTPDFTAFQAPLAVTDTNTGDLTIGTLTYTAATGVISGGTAYISDGLTLASGNNLVFQPLLGDERVLITARDVTGNIMLDQTAADTVTFFAAVAANTMTGVALTHGLTAGNIVSVFMPNVQRKDPTINDQDNVAMTGYAIGVKPLTGNDEIRIISR